MSMRGRLREAIGETDGPKRVLAARRIPIFTLAMLVCVLLMLGSARAGAPGDIFDFPPARDNSSAAGKDFDARANAVIQFDACGNEGDFWEYVQALENGDVSNAHQGDILGNIIIAKIMAWNGGQGCNYIQTGTFRSCKSNDDSQAPILSMQTCAKFNCVVTKRVVTKQNVLAYEASATQDCLHTQINEALKLYRKHDQPGTDSLPCFFQSSVLSKGNYDFDLVEVIRALYLGSRRAAALDPDTQSSLLDNVLTVRGPPGKDVTGYSIYGCGDDEDSSGGPQDYADSQGWLDQAGNALLSDSDPVIYLLKRFALILALYLTGPLANLVTQLALGAAAPVGFVGPVYLGVITGTLDPYVRIPETENHQLMIETSRFLTNQAMIISLERNGNVDPNLGVVVSQQAEVKDWLLHRLQQIAQHDFDEYNARPYSDYSLRAIANLFDFSVDPDLQTAARIILDYDSAKAAISGNRARRFAPYRRRKEYDGYTWDPDPTKKSELYAGNFYNMVEGADAHVGQMIVLAGQTQLAEKQPVELSADWQNKLSPAPDGLATDLSVQGLIDTAASGYRLPLPILELAVDRPPSFERIHHAGVEIYSSGKSFLLSAGGIQTAAANRIAGIVGDPSGEDNGIAMPTVVMPTEGGLTKNNVIQFEGVGVASDRTDGPCVADHFACGVNLSFASPPQDENLPGRSLPQVSLYSDCMEQQTVESVQWTFINSANCASALLDWRRLSPTPTPSAIFFLAAAVHNCPGDDEVCGRSGVNNYGMLEIVDAPANGPDQTRAYLDFKSSRLAALSWPPGRKGAYTLSNGGPTIVFDVLGSRDDLGGIVSVNGAPIDKISDWPFANGPIVSGGDGLIWVTGPNSKKTLTLDFRQWNAPKWSCAPLPCF